MAISTDPFQPNRSTFVTVVAWIFIVFAGFATLVAILQNVMVYLIFVPAGSIQQAALAAAQRPGMPAFVELMFGNFRLLFAGFAVLSAAVFVSSVALLHRKNWARIAFIAFLTLGIAWNIGALVLQQMMFAAMPALSTGAPPEFRNGFETMWTVMRAFSFVVAIALSIVFAWLITRLASGAVRREFRGSLWRS